MKVIGKEVRMIRPVDTHNYYKNIIESKEHAMVRSESIGPVNRKLKIALESIADDVIKRLKK